MIQFSKNFRFRETIWPICLPDKAVLDQNAYEDIGMTLAAYGPYAEGQLISKCSLQISQKTNEIVLRISALASRKILNQKKIKALGGIFFKG